MQMPKWVERVRVLVAASGLIGLAAIDGCASNSGTMDAGPTPPEQTGNKGPSAGGSSGPDARGDLPDGTTGGSDAGPETGGSSGGGTDIGGETPADGAAAGSGEGGADARGPSIVDSPAGSGDAGVDAGGQSTVDSGAGKSGEGGMGTGGTSAPGVTKDGEVVLTDAGVTIVSFGGYLNGESFQQDGIVSFQGYQYAAFWNAARHVVVARRLLPSAPWDPLEFTDYTNVIDDAHNTISLGICPGDGTIHLSFDHHVSNLHYRKSVAGVATNPPTAPWATSSFSPVTGSLVGTAGITQLTYPRFVTEPGGAKMLFDARIGNSGSGDEYLWEYDSATHAWASIGMYVNGTIDSINAYPHGLSYTKGGSRLHMAWCWRETSNASTNHDLLYIYSDDNGRIWKNNAGTAVATSGSYFVTKNSTGINMWTINQNRGLINSEHMAVDPTGRVHVLLSHMPDSQADDSTFTSARTKSQFFHYWRDTSGTWTRTAMGLPVVAGFRGKLAISSSNNVYAVLPDLRVAAASAASNFSSWVVVDNANTGRFFSDPLVDTARLVSEDKLSIFYPQASSSNIYVLDYTLR